MKIRSIDFALVGMTLLSTAALAQAPAAPLAKPSCAKPAMPDATKKYTQAESNAIVRTLEAYRNCVQTFSEGQKAIAESKQKEAEAHKAAAIDASAAATSASAAADAAAKEYNAFSDQAVKNIVVVKEPAAQQQKPTIEPPAPRPSRGY